MVHLVQCQQPTDEHGRVPGQIAASNPIAFNVDLGVLPPPRETEDHTEAQPRVGKDEGFMVTNNGKEGTKDGRGPIPGHP